MGDNDWINSHSADMNSYDSNINALSVYDGVVVSLGDVVVFDFKQSSYLL